MLFSSVFLKIWGIKTSIYNHIQRSWFSEWLEKVNAALSQNERLRRDLAERYRRSEVLGKIGACKATKPSSKCKKTQTCSSVNEESTKALHELCYWKSSTEGKSRRCKNKTGLKPKLVNRALGKGEWGMGSSRMTFYFWQCEKLLRFHQVWKQLFICMFAYSSLVKEHSQRNNLVVVDSKLRRCTCRISQVGLYSQ